MLTINTNVMALNAQLALSQQTRKIDQLSKVVTAANSEGLGEFSIGGPAAPIVPTFITSLIAGTSMAISNVDRANNLALKEKNTVSDMIDAVNTMQLSAITYNANAGSGSPNAAIAASAQSDFSSAQARLSSDISSDIYNNIDLSNGGSFQFQIGPNKNEKIILALGRLDEQIGDQQSGDLRSISIAGADTNPNYQTFIAALNHTLGSANATISQLGFTKSRLQNDYDNSTTYRTNLLDRTFSKANTELTVQRMLQNAAQAILAQANASTDGIIELIKSARVGYA